MYQNPLDHSNHRMLYSFTPSHQGSQMQQSIFPQLIDSTYHRPSPSAQYSQSVPRNLFHPHHSPSEFNAETVNKKDMRALQQDYEKLFVGGDISDVSSNLRIKALQNKSISLQKYSQQMNFLKEQYQKKIDYIQQQNEQNQKSIKQQYQLYLSKLRQQNNELIGINKQYQNEIKELLKKMQGISMSDLNNYKNENERLKLIIEQLEESRVFNRNNSKNSNSNTNPNSPRVVVQTKIIQNKDQINFLTQELQRSKRIIQNKQKQIKNIHEDLGSLQNQIQKLKKENISFRTVSNENDLMLQIERYKQIINKKNGEMNSMTNTKTSLEKQILLLEQSIEEIAPFKQKFYMINKEKDMLEESQSQLKRLLNDRVKQIEILNVGKSHMVKNQEYLMTKISTIEQRNKNLEMELKDIKIQLQNEKKKRKQKLQSKQYEQYIQDMSQTVKEFKLKINQNQRNQQNQKQNYGKQQQILDNKFNQLTLTLENKQKQLSDLSRELNDTNSQIVRQSSRIKQYEETIRTLRTQLDSKNQNYEIRRNQYEKNLIKLKNQAEIGYHKNIEQFKQKISRLEMQLASKSPQRSNNKHIRRSPSKAKRSISSQNSNRSLSANGDLRIQEFQDRINDFLKYNKSEQVYQLLQEAKLQLRYLLSQNQQLLALVKMLQTSKDLNSKSIIAEDKIRFGQARIDYINQKNMQLQQRITILIAVNTELKGRVEQSSNKIQQLQKRTVQYQQKLSRNQQFTRDNIQKNKQQYDKLFQLHTSTSSKIPALQRTISDLNRQIQDKNVIIRTMNSKTETQNNNSQNKSSYFYNRINSLNKDLEYAHQDIEQLKGKVWTLERDIDESNSQIQILKEQIRAKETEHKILLTKHSEISIDMNLKSEELAAHKLQIVTLKNTNDYLNQRLKTFALEEERKNQVTTKQILNLHNQLEQSSITLQSFKQHRQSSQQAVKEAKSQITKLNSQITQLKFTVEKKQRQLTQVKSAPQPIPRVQSRGSNQNYTTKNSTMLQQKLSKANTEISTLANKILAYELEINKMKQAQSQAEGKMMIVSQQLQSENSQKNQLQQQLNKINQQFMTVSRSSKQIQRKESGSAKQIFQLERRLKIVNQEKQSLMKELKQYVTQNHNETSQKQDKLNIFLKQNLDATQLQLQRASQSISALQAANEHYYTLIQQIPARYSYYINYMKKINSQFRYLVGQLDLTSSTKNSEVSTKLLNNISESLQIFEQIRHLEDQIESRIQDLEERKNG